MRQVPRAEKMVDAMIVAKPHWLLLATIILLAPLALAVLADELFDSAGETIALPSVDAAAQPAVPLTSANIFPTWQLTPQWTLRIRGRVDTDFLATSQSAANQATFGDLGDVIGLRRARIGAEGTLPGGRYIAEIDLASGFVVPRDVFVGLGNVDGAVEWRFGHFREPFSLESGTSANTFAFMERSPINMLDPGRNWGLGLFSARLARSVTLAGGAFHAGTDSSGFQGGDGSTVGFTGRLTAVPINEDGGERLLHFGLALSERLPENGVILINQQPPSPLLGLGDSSTSPFVPTIRLQARFQQLINLQFAAARGPLWTQAEWYGTWIAQTDAPVVFFHGCHADCGWFITGEHREYLANGGVFGPVKVRRPFLRGPAGAIESTAGGLGN